MAARFTARLPDGSDSRIAWIVWMFIGIWFGGFVVGWIIFVEATVHILADFANVSLSGPFWYAVIAVLQFMLAGVVATVCLGFATRRLLMPREVWVAVALPLVVLWIDGARAVVDGAYEGLWLPVAGTAAIVGAWAYVRHRTRAIGRAVLGETGGETLADDSD